MKEGFLRAYNEIDSLILDLLGPLRNGKNINRDAFDKLYSVLDEVSVLLKQEDDVPKKLVSKILFVYMSVTAEAEHTRYPNPLFLEVAELQERVSSAFKV